MVSPTETYARPVLQSFYAVAGRTICVEAREVWAAELFQRHFSGWHFQRSGACESPSATIRVHDAAPPPTPAGLDSFEIAPGGRCHTDGLTYHLEYDGSLVRVGGAVGARVEVFVGADESSRRVERLARLVFAAAMAAARRCGLYELHAACAVEPSGGAGVLFLGPSGAGKSTLTAQLAAAGWGYLSDDSLLLRADDEATEVYALRRAFSVTEQTINAGSLAGFEHALHPPAPSDPSKRRFDPLEIFPQGYAGSCAPTALFFASVTSEPSSRAEALGQGEAMAQLIRLCPWAAYDRASARGHLEALSRLAKGCRAYRLRAGADLLGDASRTAAFVAALL
jgi:hypothetical protein